MVDMKSPLEAPEKSRSRGTEETSAKADKPAPAAVIDTSKMAKGQRPALGKKQAKVLSSAPIRTKPLSTSKAPAKHARAKTVHHCPNMANTGSTSYSAQDM